MQFRQAVPFIFSFIFYTGASGAPQAGDFLVIGIPRECELYDQYEQQVPEAGRRSIPAEAPFEIISERQLMGDQITQAMRLSLFGSTYYIMLDDKGKTAGLPPAAAAKRYKGCIPYYDTFTVALPLSMARNPSGTGKRIRLEKNDTVLRIFTWHGLTFIYRPGSKPVCGWLRVNGNVLRPREKRGNKGENDNFSALHRRIMKRLMEANERYDTLFTYFNSRTGQDVAIPRWVAEPGKEYRYVLQGSDAIISRLERSTRQIVKDVEQMLLGKPFLAAYRQGVITIGTR